MSKKSDSLISSRFNEYFSINKHQVQFLFSLLQWLHIGWFCSYKSRSILQSLGTGVKQNKVKKDLSDNTQTHASTRTHKHTKHAQNSTCQTRPDHFMFTLMLPFPASIMFTSTQDTILFRSTTNIWSFTPRNKGEILEYKQCSVFCSHVMCAVGQPSGIMKSSRSGRWAGTSCRGLKNTCWFEVWSITLLWDVPAAPVEATSQTISGGLVRTGRTSGTLCWPRVQRRWFVEDCKRSSASPKMSKNKWNAPTATVVLTLEHVHLGEEYVQNGPLITSPPSWLIWSNSHKALK